MGENEVQIQQVTANPEDSGSVGGSGGGYRTSPPHTPHTKEKNPKRQAAARQAF